MDAAGGELVSEAGEGMEIEPPAGAAAPAPAKPAAPIEPWRTKILSDPSLHEHIRKVARRRGAFSSEVDDVLSDVLFAALYDPNLPRAAREARKRLGVVSRNKTIDRVRARGEGLLSLSTDVRVSDAASEATHGASANLEALLADRTQLEKLLEIAKKRHPNTWHWAVRRYIHRDDVKDIAQDARVGERHVRMALQKILATCAAAAATLGVLVVLFARPTMLIQDDSPRWSAAVRTSALPPPPPGPDSPEALRARAPLECDLGDFNKCATDLESAYAMDPEHETPAQAAMRKAARRNAGPPVPSNGPSDGKPPGRLKP